MEDKRLTSASLVWHKRQKQTDKQSYKIHESLYIDEIIVPEFLSGPEKVTPPSYVLEPQNVINIILKRKSSEGCDLVLMSCLQGNKTENSESGKLYLSKSGEYVVRDPKGTVQRGTLNDSGIDMNDFESKLNNAEFKKSILEVTSKRGHTRSEGLDNIKMAESQMGFLFPKIDQYRRGVWVIEPCFIHPKYEGPISVHICNLSKVPVLIQKYDPLMEMVTFELNNCPSGDENAHKRLYNSSYYRERRSEALLFPKTFLDITENVQKIKDEVGFKSVFNILILILTFFTIIIGTSGWVNWDLGKQVREAVLQENEIDDVDVKEAIDKNVKLEKDVFEREIEELKKRINALEGGS